MVKVTLLYGDVFDKIKDIDNETIDLCITSPPYWGLRDYGVERQLGLEPTMEEYLENMMKWVKDVYRVLKPSGSFVLNLGDCFCGSGKGGTSPSSINPNRREFVPRNSSWSALKKENTIYKDKQFLSVSSFLYCNIISKTDFICRGEHIWCKPNIPSPIRTRLKYSHEKLFWFVKNANKYYFDMMPWEKECKPVSYKRAKYRRKGYLQGSFQHELKNNWCPQKTIENSWRTISIGELKKDYNGKILKEKHIASFPVKLIEPYILSLCPIGGVVLDPFSGSGTTIITALKNNRNCIGIELSKEYIDMTKRRLCWGEIPGIEYSEVI